MAKKTKNVNERVIAFLFFRAEATDIPEASPKEIGQDFFEAGLGKPNITRIKRFLIRDFRTIKVGKEKWRLKADKHEEMAVLFGECMNNKKVILPETDSVIPSQVFPATRKYLIEVVRQVNGCYDISYYDSCGVMARRLVETLIIEVYEFKGIEDRIKDVSGNYYMLNELINKISSEKKIGLGRNAKRGLSDAKWLGDQSAHNRRFLAKKPDIDKVQPNIRILVQELVVLAGL